MRLATVEDSSDFEKPVHQVNITQGYWIGKYQLTQEQWMAVGSKRERKDLPD